MPEDLREFTIKELESFNGRDGRPTYVAFENRVYDLSDSKRWKNGMHMNRHRSGGDLTSDIAAAPHDPDVLDRFPQVGILKVEEEPAGPRVPLFFKVMLEAFPFLQRHPHPMTVHFPIVFSMSASAFTFLYVTTGIRAFEATAYHMLAGAVLFILVGMTTGFLTWYLNYMARPMLGVLIKIALSSLMLLICAAGFVWRTLKPGLLDDLTGFNLVYLAAILSLFPIVSVVGWFGAELTFPSQGKRKH